MRILEHNVKRIAFEDIRRPSLATNDVLHDQRQEIAYTLSQVAKTQRWIPPSVNAELEAIKDGIPAAKYIGYPDAVLQDVLDDAASLQRFLMDTFHLLMSSIGILEAEASKKQVRRRQMLTQLAFIYIPLSFVTGIFGINVREINGSPLSIWTSVVALIVTSACTAAVFVAYRRWERLSSSFKQHSTSIQGSTMHCVDSCKRRLWSLGQLKINPNHSLERPFRYLRWIGTSRSAIASIRHG